MDGGHFSHRYVPRDANPTGCYRTHFRLEGGLPPRERIFLRFDGVDAASYVWLNGTLLGHSKDSRLPFEFDATSAIHAGGDNTLAVQVLRWCDGSCVARPLRASVGRGRYLEEQDHLPNMAGTSRTRTTGGSLGSTGTCGCTASLRCTSPILRPRCAPARPAAATVGAAAGRASST